MLFRSEELNLYYQDERWDNLIKYAVEQIKDYCVEEEFSPKVLSKEGGKEKRKPSKVKHSRSNKRKTTRKKKTGKQIRRSTRRRPLQGGEGDYETEQEKHLRYHREFHTKKREKNRKAAEKMKEIGEYNYPEREGPQSYLAHPYEQRLIGPAEREARLRSGNTDFYYIEALNKNFKDQMEEATGEGIEDGEIGRAHV